LDSPLGRRHPGQREAGRLPAVGEWKALQHMEGYAKQQSRALQRRGDTEHADDEEERTTDEARDRYVGWNHVEHDPPE